MNKITSKILKSMIGKEIWTIPLSNAINRQEKDLKKQIESGFIIKVGTAKVELDNYSIGSFYIDGRLCNANFGYMPFLSNQDAIDYLDAKDLVHELKHNISFSGLSLDQLRRIENIINEKEE